ncbi:hypothetical protein HaLaN_02666 [Haematococcus lacustris]|uniref:Uncharacterized protein n=1 Tax=Haematococcus lacustris TaxID=44745 RepID=A0A699YLL6_HAELA|nr:hypothetical protein HaLaN_02666 [Haematococcus lacustris]
MQVHAAGCAGPGGGAEAGAAVGSGSWPGGDAGSGHGGRSGGAPSSTSAVFTAVTFFLACELVYSALLVSPSLDQAGYNWSSGRSTQTFIACHALYCHVLVLPLAHPQVSLQPPLPQLTCA